MKQLLFLLQTSAYVGKSAISNHFTLEAYNFLKFLVHIDPPVP